MDTLKKKRINVLIKAIYEVLLLSEEEKSKVIKNESIWSIVQIDAVISEMNEILSYAKNGIIFYKYGKKQKRLVSIYILTDSTFNLNNTKLGQSIIKMEGIFNKL